MNQNFSFKRYLWLAKRQWYENAAIYKWGIVLMILAIALLFWLSSSWKTVDNPPLGQMETFSVVGIFFLYAYSAWFFESLSSKHKRMFYFSLPVSALERVAVAFTCVMVVLPFLLLSVFIVFDFIFVQLFNYIHGTSVQMFFRTVLPSVYGDGLFIIMLLSYLSYASIFTLGSLVFGKKGPIISIVFIIVFLLIVAWIWRFFSVYTDNPNFVIDFVKSHIFMYFLPVCWTMMYFVMKKKEA